MTAPHPSFIARLVRAVAVLALGATGQLDYLRSIGVPEAADELALELHDGALLLPQFVAEGWMSESAANAIAALDRYLGSFSGPERGDLWTAEVLHVAEEWTEVRRLAEAVLKEI